MNTTASYHGDACTLPLEALDIIVAVLTILGVLGNGAFLYVVIKLPYMRTDTNLYLCGLAVADLMYLIINSITIFCYFDDVGTCQKLKNNVNFMCSTEYIISTSYLTSVITIALVGVERYLAISRPLAKGSPASRHRGHCFWLVAASSWLIALVLSTPAVAECLDIGHNVYKVIEIRLVITVSLFFLMVVVVLVFYLLIAFKLYDSARSAIATRRSSGENEKQVIRVCLLTAVVFVVCLLPYMIRLVGELFILHGVMPYSAYTYYCMRNLAILPLIINAVINPVVYSVASRRYRRAFHVAFCGCGRGNVRYPVRSTNADTVIDSGQWNSANSRSSGTKQNRRNMIPLAKL
ncbi:somatostatin receptor type 4-like [Saccoglossus kowalevskii]|uniref:Somatostatin receptor type 5-like n=1 Tax=Saccoglossus kowalevskii TaxID=10224 RepID=A0ABM0MU24_SACKO|nr:PREDICTED: somatostatin receptor type 5-like [Saccoglossus kowalevskii]